MISPELETTHGGVDLEKVPALNEHCAGDTTFTEIERQRYMAAVTQPVVEMPVDDFTDGAEPNEQETANTRLRELLNTARQATADQQQRIREDALTQLYVDLRPRIAAFLGNRYPQFNSQLVEDLTSETFMLIVRDVNNNPNADIQHPLAWAKTIANRAALSHIRPEERRNVTLVSLSPVTERADSDRFANVENTLVVTQLLRSAMERGYINRRQAACLLLRLGAELPIKEAAAILGVKENTVPALTYRAITRLIASLGETENDELLAA